MDRRAFLGALAGSVLAAPLAAEAQRAGTVPRVGWLSLFSRSDPQFQRSVDLFRQTLRELGYVEGQSVAIEYRWAEGKSERLVELATELARMKVDVIVADGGVPPAQAAQRATKTIPIVFSGPADPVAAGLVASLARPGGNITGPTLLSEELVGKQLELLIEVVPKMSRVAVLWNPTNAGNARQLRAAEAAASGLRLQPVGARDSAEIEKAFVAMTRQRADGLVVLIDAILYGERERIAALAAQNRLPAVYGYSVFAESGGLMSYAGSRSDMRRQMAVYVDKILKGAKPANLPVERPIKFDLVINLKTAKALGLTIPPSLLQRADQVIE
jgi:putative tryptophan/tyrosine transport system substrate-binding protein